MLGPTCKPQLYSMVFKNFLIIFCRLSIAAAVLCFCPSCSSERNQTNRNRAENMGRFLVYSIVKNASYEEDAIKLDIEDLHKVQKDLTLNKYNKDIIIYINSKHWSMSEVSDIMAPRLIKVIYKDLPFIIQIGDHETQNSMFEWNDINKPGERWIPIESIIHTQ